MPYSYSDFFYQDRVMHTAKEKQIIKNLACTTFLLLSKDGSHNWGGFAHIESYVSYCLGAHFMKFWDPSFGKMQKDIKYSSPIKQ